MSNRTVRLKKAADELRDWADRWQSEDCESFMLLISDETIDEVREIASKIERDKT